MSAVHSINSADPRGIEADIPQLLTLRQFCSKFSWPSESAMRAYVYKAPSLGLENAFVRVGRRVLVDPKSFFSLVRGFENRTKSAK